MGKKLNQGLGMRKGLIGKGSKGTLGGDGNVLYLDFDGAFMTVYICHTSLNYVLENSEFYCT